MRMYSRAALLLLSPLMIAGCDRSKEAPRLPLGHPDLAAGRQSGQPVTPAISGEAKVALDSGNALYKTKAYASALAQYRRAATIAPAEEAPLIGMIMVANVTSNSRLADSVAAKLRSMNSALFSGADSLSAEQMRDIHAGVRPPASPHPPKNARKL